MNRYYNPRDPVVPRRPQRIELPETSRKWIIMTLGLALAAAMVFLAVYFMSFLPSGAGWRQIETPHSATGCQTQYVFQYDLGRNGDATAQNKAISALYTQATDDAWKALSNTAYEGINNLAVLNAHPNEEVLADPILDWALEQMGNSRVLYRAPLYAYYSGLYHCGNDVDAAVVDPEKNQQAADYVAALTAFTENADAVSLERLGEGRVMLHVSQAYLDFAGENELSVFLDFGWLKNALILDYTAELLVERGYPDGTISSFDGFTRSLGADEYTVNLYSQLDGKPRQVAAAHFTGPMAQVSFRSMPLYGLDDGNYYSYEDGTLRGPYVAADGTLRSGCDNLLLLSQTGSCAELAMAGLPAFTSEIFRGADLTGMGWISTQGSTVHHGGTGFTVEVFS